MSIPSLRQALARIARYKAATAVMLVALGLSLGAVICAAQFARLVSSGALPYPQQDRLFVLEQVLVDRDENGGLREFSYPAVELLHEGASDMLSPLVMLDHARDLLVSHPAQPLLSVTYISPGYAALFAPPMALGRFPDTAQNLRGESAMAAISYSTWKTLFDLREDVIGQIVRTASGASFEVVGVTAPHFVEPEFHAPGHRTALWLPWSSNPSPRQWGWTATTGSLTLAGRLAPAVDASAAGERLSTLLGTRWRERSGTSEGRRAAETPRVQLIPAGRAIAGSSLDVAPLLLAGTLGLILITLANVVHIMVARVAERAHEFSIQRALGASGKHLFNLVLVDALLLMVLAGVIALAVAAAGIALMQSYLGSMLPRLEELSVGWQTAVMIFGVALVLAVLLAGTAFATCTRASAIGWLNVGRQGTAGKVPHRLRAVLMASQVGLAGVLIAFNFGLLRETTRILGEPGIELDRSASAFLYQSASAPQRETPLAEQFDEVRRRLADLPDVEMVSQSHSPLQEFIKTSVVSGRSGRQYPVGLKRIDHDYLEISGQTLALGRNFSASDIHQATDVALVNAAFARVLEREGGVLDTQLSREGGAPHSIVGVVEDLTYPGTSVADPHVYLPASQAGSSFVIRFQPGHRMSREQLVTAIADLNPGLGVFLYDDLSVQKANILLPRRITAASASIIALVVVLASAMGLFGMVSYATRLARAEIAARLAFGARAHHIMWMLVRRHGAALAGGAALSSVAALLLSGVVSQLGAQAFSLSWMDVAVALVGLGVLAVLACYLSARPLLSQPPSAALREVAL